MATQLWLSTNLFLALSSHTFPNLRYLRVVSRLPLLPTSPKNLGFWQFICNHPQLSTIILDTSSYQYASSTGLEFLTQHLAIGEMMTPQDLLVSMPLVRHFAGPCMVIEALLKSNLAAQLDALGIVKSYPSKLGSCGDLFSKLKSLALVLPCLKKLRISSHSMPHAILSTELVGVIRAMPNLEELVVVNDSDQEINLHITVSNYILLHMMKSN